MQAVPLCLIFPVHNETEVSRDNSTRRLQMNHRILIVDDDKSIVKMLQKYLTIKGYEIVCAENGKQAVSLINKKPDIILLDINMPQMDGLEVCKTIRGQISCPILFLTARVEEEDKIQGLMVGGDDYILKPFSLKELEARIFAHLKREERHKGQSDYRFHGNLLIDYTAKKVRYKDTDIELTRMEYGILEFLSLNPGQVFDKERIYERICGYDAEGNSRVITELTRRIRKKLSAYTQEEYIETVWGSGYRWKK